MLIVDDIAVRYEQKTTLKNFSFAVEDGDIVSIIGPNGSGKSTLLKAISRQTPYYEGVVYLDQKNVRTLRPKEIAKKMCMLSQKNEAPPDMTVEDLVAYGRYPHKKWYERLHSKDYEIIEWALEKTYLTNYRERLVTELSGGESQRAWLAMALAQRPKVLLLDEPTTYLDIAHQHEVLELVRELNKEMNMTVIMVLHDLNQASQYSDQVIVVQNGKKVMDGPPKEVMTEEMIRNVYCMNCEIQYRACELKPRIYLLHKAN